MSQFQNKIKLHFKLPKFYNNGIPVHSDEFIQVKNYFLEKYGGLSVDSPTMGYWKNSGMMYTDLTMEYMMLIEKTQFEANIEPVLLNEVELLKEQFQQLEILCYYHEVIST